MIAAFLTGSRVYGEPTDASDIDLCVLLDQKDFEILRRLSETCTGSNGDSMMFGKLNLLALSAEDFAAWKEATEKLVAMRPVSREKAVQVIEAVKARNKTLR